MQIYIILFFAVITAVISQLLFKKGASSMNLVNFHLDQFYYFFISILKNPSILFGLISYGVSFILWIVVLSRMKLSIAYPITSMNFVLVILASYYFFGEKISFIQIGGIILILVGVLALAKT